MTDGGSHLGTHSQSTDRRRNVQTSRDGDVSEAGLETLGPDGEPGDRVDVYTRGEAQDDGPVLVAPEAGHGALLVRQLDPVRTGAGTRAHHEEGLRLVAAEDQVLDHQGLAVDDDHVSAVGSPSGQRSQDLRRGKTQLDLVQHQNSAYHLLKIFTFFMTNTLHDEPSNLLPSGENSDPINIVDRLPLGELQEQLPDLSVQGLHSRGNDYKMMDTDPDNLHALHIGERVAGLGVGPVTVQSTGVDKSSF